MTGEVLTKGNERKFIPILRVGEWPYSAPSWLAGKYYVDLRGEPYSEPYYKDLLATVLGTRPQAPRVGTRSTSTGEPPVWDVFLCHAGEDKEKIAFPITQALSDAGFTCWYREVKWGDSLTARINNGLLVARYVIVVFSENFLGKQWPERELNAAMNIESATGQVKVLPLVAGDEEAATRIVRAYPLLNDKYHLRWTGDSNAVVAAFKSIHPSG